MEEDIELLKLNLSKINIIDVVNHINREFFNIYEDGTDIYPEMDIQNKTNFISPLKECLYLAGLLMSTIDNSNVFLIRDNNFSSQIYEIEEAINRITIKYMTNFINRTEEDSLVSMDAFSSYFNMGILCTESQTFYLLNTLYKDFEDEIIKETSLSINDYINFYKFIRDKVYKQWDDAINKQVKVRERSCIQKQFLIDKFGEEKTNFFLEKFSMKREKRNFMYYNQDNPANRCPLFWINEQTLAVMEPFNFLLNSIFSFLTGILENINSKILRKFNERKGIFTEERALYFFEQIFKDNAKYHVNVCEKKGTNEHDILIEYKDYILVIEVKATKFREPLFNPEKAYKRIRDDFFSVRGIGGAYEQALKLKKMIEDNTEITLYEDMNKPFVIKETSSKKILPIVITLNQFGVLAVKSSDILDLNMSDIEIYPWVCDIYTLELIIKVINSLGKNMDDFIEYISWRMTYNKNIRATDEMDIVDMFFTCKEQLMRLVQNKIEVNFSSSVNIINTIFMQEDGVKCSHPLIGKK